MLIFQVLSQIYTYLPSKLSERQWKVLAGTDSMRERFDYMKFSRHVERKKAKEEQRKTEKTTKKPDEAPVSKSIVEGISPEMSPRPHPYLFCSPKYLRKDLN